MKKYDKILSILIIISGAFALVCYVSYFIKLFVYPEGTLPIIACVTVILGVCLPISLDKYIRKLTKKAYPVLKTVYCAALCFYMVTFTAMSVFVYSGVSSGPAPEKLPPDTVFVTFGAKRKELALDADGSVKEKRVIDFTVVTDERICDGFYYARAFKMFKQFMRKPEVLDLPPEKVEEDLR